MSAVRCVVTPIGLESGRDVSVCLSQIHKLFFHSLSLNGERAREREKGRETGREMWRMTASVRLGIYGCLSLSVKLLSLLHSPSLFLSLTHSHDFLSLSFVRFICANIYAELSCQLMSHSCPASAPSSCVCVPLMVCEIVKKSVEFVCQLTRH